MALLISNIKNVMFSVMKKQRYIDLTWFFIRISFLRKCWFVCIHTCSMTKLEFDAFWLMGKRVICCFQWCNFYLKHHMSPCTYMLTKTILHKWLQRCLNSRTKSDWIYLLSYEKWNNEAIKIIKKDESLESYMPLIKLLMLHITQKWQNDIRLRNHSNRGAQEKSKIDHAGPFWRSG